MKEQDLRDALNRIEISDEARNRILEKSKTATYRKEEKHMKSKKKFAVIAIAATFVLSLTAFAASGIITSWNSSSSSIPEYTELPTEQQVIKDIGYVGDMVEEFSNGYVFKDGNVVTNALKDDSSNTVEKFKSLSLTYSTGENDVYLSIDKYDSDMPHEGKGAEVIAQSGGVDIYEHSFINKIIPEDYVKSEEELAAEERGTLTFAYDGEDHIVEMQIKSVSWTKDDIRYNLMQMDGELSAEELTEMAKELIEQK